MELAAKKCSIFGLVISLLFTVDATILELPRADQSLPKKHFVLIHGACHGGWSYYKIVAPLTSFGHNVTAIDLAGSGVDPQQAKDFRTITHYHQPLMDFVAALPQEERVILVGHSFGGLAVCQAMEEFPDKIAAAVFVTASMPGPKLSLSRASEELQKYLPPSLDNVISFDDQTLTSGPLFLRSFQYQRSPVEDWELAKTLMRPMRLFNEKELEEDLVFTEENYGRVKRVFIMADKDLSDAKEYQQWMIDNNPPDEVMEILGSDHMVMMSKPDELAFSLLDVARKYD